MSRRCVLLLLCAVMGAAAVADAEIINQVASSVSRRADGTGTIGNQFWIYNTAITINALGVHDADADGFLASGGIQVGLWNVDTGTLLRSTTVQSTDPLGANNYRYASVESFTLLPHVNYALGAVVGMNFEPFISDTKVVFTGVDANVTVFRNLYGGFPGTALVMPTNELRQDLSCMWGPANATFITPSPEPGSIVLLTAGLVGLLAYAWRKRK